MDPFIGAVLWCVMWFRAGTLTDEHHWAITTQAVELDHPQRNSRQPSCQPKALVWTQADCKPRG